ncbi:hypothetical protein ACORG1_33300 (plasmid) [Mycobacterium sp. TJFP1]|mgnify:CR=1 FL=1
MVFLNSDRMVTVTDAKPKFNALVAEARDGRPTHIIRGAEVVAHLVPPTARIIDQDALLSAMVEALLYREAQEIRDDPGSIDRVPVSASSDAGRLFTWAWTTDPQLFTEYLGRFRTLLTVTLSRPLDVPEVLEIIRNPMLGKGLADSEIDAAHRYALTRTADLDSTR